MKRYTRILCTLWSISALVVTLALSGSQPARAARAQAVSVSSFYTTTAQAYKNWKATNYAAPPPQQAFPAGTTEIAFYFKFAGAGKNSGFYIVLRKHQGATFNVTGWWQLSSKSTEEMSTISDPDGAFPNGAYDADLVVDFHLMGTVAISIGTGNAGTGGNSGTGSSTGGVKITSFRAVTIASENVWAKQKSLYPLPARIAAFSAGTSEVGFAFLYAGVTPQATTEEIVMSGPNGLKLADVTKPSTFSAASGGRYSWITAPQHLAYPNGSYTAAVLINGQPAAQTTFTIG